MGTREKNTLYEAGPKSFYPHFLQSISDKPGPAWCLVSCCFSQGDNHSGLQRLLTLEVGRLIFYKLFPSTLYWTAAAAATATGFFKQIVHCYLLQDWLKRILSRLVWHIGVGGKNTAVEDIFFLQSIKIEEMTVCLYRGFLNVAWGLALSHSLRAAGILARRIVSVCERAVGY